MESVVLCFHLQRGLNGVSPVRFCGGLRRRENASYCQKAVMLYSYYSTAIDHSLPSHAEGISLAGIGCARSSIQAYVEQKKWAMVEPVPGWKSPSSLLMSGMANLFRLSVWIRQIHTYLTNTLGIPSWGSYVIFAIITLFMGLMLGLMLVLIADCIWPSRPKHRENKTVVIVKEEVSEEEVEDILTEEKHASDLDNESERVSGDESTEEEGAMSDGATAGSDQPPPEGAAESSVRKRKPLEKNTTDGT